MAGAGSVSDPGRTYVWIDAWEQQCCGEPFRAGGAVSWEANERPGAEWVAMRLGPDWAARIRFAQEHHGDDPEGVLTGTIARIDAVACRRRRIGRTLELVLGSGQLGEVRSDAPWVPSGGTEVWTHDGWIVELRTARFKKVR